MVLALATWTIRNHGTAPTRPKLMRGTPDGVSLEAAHDDLDIKRGPAERTRLKFRILLETGKPASRARLAIPKPDREAHDRTLPYVTASEDGIAELPIPPGIESADLRVAALWLDAERFPRWLDTRLDLAKLPADPDAEIELRFPELSRLRIQLVGPDGSFLAREGVSVSAFLALDGSDPAKVAFGSMNQSDSSTYRLLTDDIGEIEIRGISPALTLKFDFYAPGSGMNANSRVETDLLPGDLPGYFKAKPEGTYFVRVFKYAMPEFEIQALDDGDKPVPGAVVCFYLAGPADDKPALQTSKSGITDQSGRLKIGLAANNIEPAVLEGCSWWIAAFSPKLGAGYAKGVLSLRARTGIVRLVSVDNRQVRGRLISQESGAPLPGLEIELVPFFRNAGAALTTTDDTGEFVFSRLMPPPDDWRPPGLADSDLAWEIRLPRDSRYEFAEESNIMVEGRIIPLGRKSEMPVDFSRNGEYKLSLKE